MAIRISADPDPIIDCGVRIRRGVSLDSWERAKARRLVCYGVGDPGNTNEGWCGERNPGPEGGVCSRPKDHPKHWKHVAATSSQVLGTWGGGDAPDDGEFLDPEDGTPEDPAESVATADSIVAGGVYRLKDRKNTLLVIGNHGSRADGQVDVLDFTKREYRAVPAGEMVVDPATQMSVEDFLFSIEYAQKTRMSIKDQAVANYHNRKWCEAGLQDALRDLGLPAYVPTQRGDVLVRVPYSAVTGMPTSKVKELVAKAVNVDELKVLLGGDVDPEDDDELTVRTDDIKIEVKNVGRS